MLKETIEKETEQYNRNAANSSALILRNANTINTNISPSENNPELVEILKNIKDADWRDFFKVCING